MNNELEQVATLELIEELVRRSDSLIISFAPLADKDGEIISRLHGHVHKVAGLSKIIEFEIDGRIKYSLQPD